MRSGSFRADMGGLSPRSGNFIGDPRSGTFRTSNPNGANFANGPNRGAFRGSGDFARNGNFHGNDRFHDGHFHGDDHFHGAVIVGWPWFGWYGTWPYYDPFYYPYGYYYPSTDYTYAVGSSDYAPLSTQGAVSEPPHELYWYYCDDPDGYYPYVRNCNHDWQAIPAQPPFGAPPPPGSPAPARPSVGPPRELPTYVPESAAMASVE
jgi:hypothetical protein